ncbi:hypothetical protein ACFYUV_42985 [Nonomuraea sp. NPDC003560]|uniref:hypothetical protein n=1 Tax=Nonomuraea sp. NPDC003560 TaxID=3364341 RepID=UPI00367CD76D
MHLGRLWTNGDPFLAVDASLRDAWRGFSGNQYDRLVDLGPETAGIPVGAGRAVLAGTDGVVRDDSWLEVFEADDGAIAIVQASGPPSSHGRPSRDGDPDLLVTTTCTTFAFKVRWHTQLDDENCFARWLLIPHEPRDQPTPE